MRREQRHHGLDEGPRALGVGVQDGQDHVDRHVIVTGVPAIVVRHHRHCRVTNFSFAGELGFRHVRHADDIATPAAVKLAFGKRRELRALHDDVGTAALQRAAGRRARFDDGVADAAANRPRHRDMCDAARPEKAFLARESAVDELIDDDKVAGRQIFAQATDRR